MKSLAYRFLESIETGTLEVTQAEFRELQLACNEMGRQDHFEWRDSVGVGNHNFTGIRVAVISEVQ
ncbi:MAG: hypothetical protein AB7O86_05960 [Porticoccaceae bacterium]